MRQRFAVNDKLTTCHYLPFNEKQLLTYLKDRLHWDDKTYGHYHSRLRAAPSLRTLLRNPLVLRLFWQSWDTLSTRPLDQLTRSDIYAGFIGQAVNSSKNLLEAAVLDELSAGHASLAASFTAFACKVAMLACEKRDIALSADNPRINSAWNGFQVLAEREARRRYRQRETDLAQQAPETKKEQARRMVLTEDDFVRMRRQKAMQLASALPLRPRATTLEFVHKSVFEYCVAQGLADMLKHKPERISNETLKDMVSWLRTTSPDALLLLHEELDKAAPDVALHLHKQALEIRKKALGDDHLDTADSLHRMGELLKALNRVNEALAHAEEALGTRLKSIPQHADTAKTYQLKGMLQQRRGEYEEALKSLQAALEILGKVPGQNGSDIAQPHTDVTLVQSMIGQLKGAQELAKLVKEDKLYLGKEQSEDTIKALAVLLEKRQCMVKELDLGFAKIKDAGVILLSEALKVNSTLNSLDLYGNDIGDAGAAALSEALKVNRTLTCLNLCSNKIGDAGAASLSEALKANRTLALLGLGDNDIYAAGAASLAAAIKVSRTLKGFSIWGLF